MKKTKCVFIILFSLFSLKICTNTLLADEPRTPHTYRVFSSDKKYIFIMLSPEEYQKSEMTLPYFIKKESKEWQEHLIKRIEEIRQIRAKYKVSGLYRNDGSTEPLWTVNWYGHSVVLLSDGIHLVKIDAMPSKSSDEVLAFFENGKLIKHYSICDLVKDVQELPHSVSFLSWIKSMKLDDNKNILMITIENDFEYKFDIQNGNVITKSQ